MRVIALLTLLAIGAVQDALGKAAYYGPEQMITNAQCIAIVNITSVHTNSPGVRGKAWTYHETADAMVERVFKGQLPETVTLHGGENFICAQVRYRPGRHLVFLRRDGQLVTVINWHLGVRPITGEQVEWFSDPRKTVFKLSPAPLSKVTAEIREQLARERSPESPLPGSIP